MGIVTCISEQRMRVARKVLVDLKARHPLRLRRDRDYAFASQVCRVGNGGWNVLRP
jgi:hypothetical protein